MTFLILRTMNRRGILYEVTGIIKDFANIEVVYATSTKDNEGIIVMKLSNSLPIDAFERLKSIDGIIEVWATHELPFEFMAIDKDILRNFLSRLLEEGLGVKGLLNKFGFELGFSLATNLVKNRYNTLIQNVHVDKALEALLHMLVALNLVKGVSNVRVGSNDISVTLQEPFDVDVGLPFTRGFVAGALKALTKSSFMIDVIVNRTDVELHCTR